MGIGAGKIEKREDGVITVFFSLVLMLVMALILTMAESARNGACAKTAESMLCLGTKSLLSSYDLSLYENYHVFGRFCEDMQTAKTELSNELSWYMEQNLSGESWLRMEMSEAQAVDISVLTQNNGAMFYAQAVQYEKYRETKEFADWLLLASDEAEKAEKTGVLLQKTFQVQQRAAEVEGTLTELLGCMDGFTVEEGSIVRNIFGKIKTTGSFAKKLVPGGAGEWLLGGQKELYRAQKDNYRDPAKVAQRIISYKNGADRAEEMLMALWEQYEKIDDTFVSEKEEAAERIEEVSSTLEFYQSAFSGEISGFLTNISGAKTQSEKALLLLSRLQREKKEAKEALLLHAEEIEKMKGEIPEEIYEQLRQENAELLAEFSKENEIGILKDMSGVQAALEKNIVLFETAYKCMKEVQAYSGNAALLAVGATAAAGSLAGLNISALQLDYASVKVPERSNPYAKLVRQFVKYGLLSLVVEDTDNVSKGVIRQDGLASLLYNGETEKGAAFSFKKLLKGAKDDVFSLQCGDIGSFAKKSAEELAQEYLYLAYLKNHFFAYTDEIEIKSDVSGVAEGLLYQLEYIIAGEKSDWGNLSEIAAKLVLIRFAMNLAVILASGECRSQVKTAAVSAVGFTGIGALVMAAELLIAMLWAAECAVVEVSGLLMGGEVAFFPSGKMLAVTFQELSEISKSVWQQKAKRYTETNASGILKTYREYLYVFLAWEERGLRTMRTMDLVQQVMQLKYDDSFRMQNCISKVKTKAEIRIPYLFLPVIGVKEKEGEKNQIKYEISY